jgi:glycine cleavage system H protein
MMNYPKNLKFSKTHEWVQMLDDTTAYVGLSDYAQKAMGDLVFVNLPESGDEVTAGETFADVESVKAVSDVYSPVTGIILEINEELLDHPEYINENPYTSWFAKVGDISDKADLMEADDYEAFLKNECE